MGGQRQRPLLAGGSGQDDGWIEDRGRRSLKGKSAIIAYLAGAAVSTRLAACESIKAETLGRLFQYIGEIIDFVGERGGTRTHDPLIKS
jgi:hypothetical protein